MKPKRSAKKAAHKTRTPPGTTKDASKVAATKGAAPRAGAPTVVRARRPRSAKELRERAAEYYRRLIATYPDAHCALDHENPFQLLVATILSAQCTDKRVNIVTPELFRRYPGAADLADAERDELEEQIKSTGFFRSKAKSLMGMAHTLVERHGGKVPDTMEQLTELPGVGRKTANVVLGNAFHRNVGIVVDTHVTRLANRLGLTRETDPVKIEAALMPLFPTEEWTMLSHLLIEHGRRMCVARVPRCEHCVLNDICPSSRV